MQKRLITPRKISMSPKKGPFQIEISSSNHQFSGGLPVYRGGSFVCDITGKL